MKTYRVTFTIAYKTKAGTEQHAHRHFEVKAATEDSAIVKAEPSLKNDPYLTKGRVVDKAAKSVDAV
jgi:hypothetical protein